MPAGGAVEPLPGTAPEALRRDFASRGIVVLPPEALGIPLDIHKTIYAKEREAFNARRYITAALIPEVIEVVESPGVVAACDALAGKDWAIVPFTHNTPFPSGARDQHWHKDDNGPYNLRKHRHHQAIQIEMLYYPQEVRPDNGPTAVVPYSQYWTFNHEENHDNFAGADHLDFNYQVDGMERIPVSGPDSRYDPDDIANRSTTHDIRMRQAVLDTRWPLVAAFEAAPLKAGSVVLYSHNLFHRGNHRRDDWRTWRQKPRFLWRFWIYRTTEPDGEAPEDIDWRGLAIDPMTGVNLADASDDATALWRHHHHWLCTGKPPRRVVANGEAEARRLASRLLVSGEAAEPIRIGAAYRLATIADTGLAIRLLGEALYCERESVRRAATYGLVALGTEATDIFRQATGSAVKWVRKAGVHGLGDVAPLTSEVLAAVTGRLADDASVYVRSVAAGAIGGLVRRAVASGTGVALLPACAKALVGSLGREHNRLAMNVAQNRSIKFVRPTDECDVCEGIGIDYSTERFNRVRSAVRENALSSMVVLCTHGGDRLGDELQPTIAVLAEVVRSDDNVFSVGLALDALNRLAHHGPGDLGVQELVMDLLADMPIHSWEPLVRSGMDRSVMDQFSQAEIDRP